MKLPPLTRTIFLVASDTSENFISIHGFLAGKLLSKVTEIEKKLFQ